MKRCNDVDYNRTHDITIEEIKACSAFRHFTDEQAEEVIETFKILTKIAYDLYKKQSVLHGSLEKNP